MEYKYKLLRDFTTTVVETRCHLWLNQSQSNSLQGHTKQNRTEEQWLKGHWILTKLVPTNFAMNYGKLKNLLLQKCFVRPCTNVVQIDKNKLT